MKIKDADNERDIDAEALAMWERAFKPPDGSTSDKLIAAVEAGVRKWFGEPSEFVQAQRNWQAQRQEIHDAVKKGGTVREAVIRGVKQFISIVDPEWGKKSQR